MATKRRGDNCYEKAGMDEPIFTLRAQDILAAGIVREWALQAELGGTKPGIVAEARECADQMQAWPFHKHPGTSVDRHSNLSALHPPQAAEGIREALQKLVDKLKKYSSKNGLGPFELSFALQNAERALLATQPSATEAPYGDQVEDFAGLSESEAKQVMGLEPEPPRQHCRYCSHVPLVSTVCECICHAYPPTPPAVTKQEHRWTPAGRNGCCACGWTASSCENQHQAHAAAARKADGVSQEGK